VPNCSFEDTLKCPDGGVDGNVKDWSCFGGDSPDYFNACFNGWPGFGVPANILGFQYAATGNAYTGIVPYCGTNCVPGREWIGTQLIEPLNIGQTYYVSFKTSFAGDEYDPWEIRYATNKLGILFSTVSYDCSVVPPVNNFAHLYSDSIITDTVNWYNINGWVTADSAYQYIILGNFFDDSNTDTIGMNDGSQGGFASYYYIDDVCVSIDSAQCACVLGNGIEPKSHLDNIQVYLKTNDLIVVDRAKRGGGIFIYDMLGRAMVNTKLKDGLNQINVTSFSSGTYFLTIVSDNEKTTKKIFISK